VRDREKTDVLFKKVAKANNAVISFASEQFSVVNDPQLGRQSLIHLNVDAYKGDRIFIKKIPALLEVDLSD